MGEINIKKTAISLLFSDVIRRQMSDQQFWRWTSLWFDPRESIPLFPEKMAKIAEEKASKLGRLSFWRWASSIIDAKKIVKIALRWNKKDKERVVFLWEIKKIKKIYSWNRKGRCPICFAYSRHLPYCPLRYTSIEGIPTDKLSQFVKNKKKEDKKNKR